jgi:hypothetical protein
MKKFRQIISEVAQPTAGDEINFKEKHIIDHILDPNSEEDQFTADKIKKFANRADYKKGEDMAVYEGVTLSRRDVPGQEDEDIDNDGQRTKADAQLRYRRHAQIKSKIIDEAADKLKAANRRLDKTIVKDEKGDADSFLFDGSRKGNVKGKQLANMDEAKMSAAEMKKREEIVMSMKKNAADLKKRYGKDWESVMYAIATKQAMNESNHEWETDSAKVKKSNDPKFISKMIEKWGSRGGAWLNHPALTEALDPVGKEDEDVDNDGKITKSDAYLRARRKAIAKKLQQEGLLQQESLMDVLQPVGGEYGDEEKSHVAYKKKNQTNPEHHGEPVEVKEESDLHEVSKKTLGRYIKSAGPDRERLMKRAQQTSQLGHDFKSTGDTKKAQELFYKAGGDVLKAANRKAGINKAVDKLTKEDVSLAKPKTGMRVYSGKTKQAQISEMVEHKVIDFADGSSMRLTAEQAETIDSLLFALDESNAHRMAVIMTSGKEGFNEIMKFAKEVL